MELVSNNGETTQLGGVTGRGFMPGQSGNPSGRPKGIARAVREACGGDADEVIQGLLAIARGEGVNGKAPRPADQIRAYEILLAYGWGKPASFVPVEGDPLDRARSQPRSGLSLSNCVESEVELRAQIARLNLRS